jgi:hypothetical protein
MHGPAQPAIDAARGCGDSAAMLQMRPNCECCDVDLAPDGERAMICSFECTFCADCAERRLGGRCPNCGGVLVARPPRAAALLMRYPASTERVLKSHPACAGA